MRIINLYASHRSLTADSRFAGLSGENRATQLVIRLDSSLMGDYDYYLRFCTPKQASRGGMTITGKLDPQGGIILFSLPASLMEAGLLRVQLMVTDGDTTIFSPTLKGGLEIARSIEGEANDTEDDVTAGETGTPEADDLISFYDMSEYVAKRATVGAFLKNFAKAENVSVADLNGYYVGEDLETVLNEIAAGVNQVAASLNGLV